MVLTLIAGTAYSNSKHHGQTVCPEYHSVRLLRDKHLPTVSEQMAMVHRGIIAITVLNIVWVCYIS
jgi:hypothetical protein